MIISLSQAVRDLATAKQDGPVLVAGGEASVSCLTEGLHRWTRQCSEPRFAKQHRIRFRAALRAIAVPLEREELTDLDMKSEDPARGEPTNSTDRLGTERGRAVVGFYDPANVANRVFRSGPRTDCSSSAMLMRNPCRVAPHANSTA